MPNNFILFTVRLMGLTDEVTNASLLKLIIFHNYRSKLILLQVHSALKRSRLKHFKVISKDHAFKCYRYF